MNRKTFIQQTSLAAGALLMPSFLWSFAENSAKVKVVIIGGGFSGLAAAYQLKQKGISFVVLESRNRIGGRVFSHPMSNDLVIELGGEWVGNSHTRIQELCGEFNIPLQNNQFDTHLIYKNQYSPAGKWDYSDEWRNKFEGLLKKYPDMSEAEKLKLDQYDWWRYLVDNGCSDRDLDIRELLDSTDFGESIRHVSAFAALAEYAESSPKNEMDLKMKGGNAQLAKAFAKRIGTENIRLKHHVAQIDQTGKKVKVRCSNGTVIECNKVICTAPTFALSRINWLPALPTDYADAVRQLQYARIQKHALHFTERFWGDESFDLITDQSPLYFYHATKNQPSKEGVLIAYSIGDKAMMNANQTNEFQAQDVFRCLEPHFGNIKPLLKDQVGYYWGNDEYSRGAYAVYGIDQWFKLRPILAQPFMNTHFAGEHLADWQGFMEGAIETGEAAAENVFKS
ncbi:FAD-dependent oxidoreductase [Kaistella flava (ex Peng et al. 2021)]|uniref:FAD-dependent oxidoreductase n=1 Tax=Kaistella flava (ex Peng et al. 2021) TaxID=2038776 RepID=A0A7M2Y5V4_9FLAO|nr:NAD(P)/FAD-dependent oxidoreductase [Kaistella flava (ex Peng et al. 2021)]QOW09219.1 FAD-dependent oxidoreductase [Kaistella flava (ex Peng et al. 2021)]